MLWQGGEQTCTRVQEKEIPSVAFGESQWRNISEMDGEASKQNEKGISPSKRGKGRKNVGVKRNRRSMY